MSKRASLPGAAELFRPTKPAPEVEPAREQAPADEPPAAKPSKTDATGSTDALPAATGRIKHDRKITVYFSAEELYALEDAVLALRRHHHLTLDRGRFVRTAVALALQDLVANAEDAEIVKALEA